MPTLRKLTKLIHRRSLWTPLPFRGENSVSTTFLLSDFQSAAESKDGQECRSTHSAKLIPACGLTGPDEASDERTSPTAMPGRPAHPTKPARDEASPPPENETSGMQDIRGRYTQRGFSKSAAALLTKSCRSSTQRAYNTYIQKWKNYAAEQGIEIMPPSIGQVAVGFCFLLLFFFS